MMKTYGLYCLLCACLILGCSRSDDASQNSDDGPNVDATYSLVVQKDGILTGALLNANSKNITINPNQSPFVNTVLSNKTYRWDNKLSFYHSTTNCDGEFSIHDFKGDNSQKIAVFEDIGDCAMNVNAIAHCENELFVAYEVPGMSPKDVHYFVRTIDFSDEIFMIRDVEVPEKPIEIVFSNNRLFILTIEANTTEKNALMVLDTQTNGFIHEINLGSDARGIVVNNNGDILVTYVDQHLVVNNKTIAITSTTRYLDGKEPKFEKASNKQFDTRGNLYYERPAEMHSIYPTIPAVYDFSQNTVYLYVYERFLSQEQHQFEFEIGNTTAVSYDEGNDLILIGYSKSGSSAVGGLLRIKPAPNPQFIDNIDLDGIPYEIFVK